MQKPKPVETIEDKLNNPFTKLNLHDSYSVSGYSVKQAKADLQAIITTETTRLGASEKHQCICKDCGKQVDTRSETATKQ